MRQGKGFAHGKIILIGEHSVVYGKPAIAVPFPSTKITALVSEANTEITIDCLFYRGLLKKMPELLASLHKAIDLTLELLNKEMPLSIKIESSIPAERGMGSSAAVSVATIRAIFDYYETPLSYKQLLDIVAESEKIAHGNPSGLDALMTSSTTPYFFIKNEVCEPITLNMEAVLIVADTGQTGKTKQAVADVASQMRSPETQKFIQVLGEYSQEAKNYLENNQPDKLGDVMTQAHTLLQKLNVSNESLDHLVSVSLANGALGAKLTGGGRGGCMIALAKNITDAKHISKQLKAQGAKQTWLYEMSELNEQP